MATIDKTVGGPDANSYLNEADANTLVSTMVLTDDVKQWSDASTDGRVRALISAAQRLDRERFLGARVSDTQSMQWPRDGVIKPDTYFTEYTSGFPFNRSRSYFGTDEIPDQIKRAQVELAVYLNANPAALGVTGLAEYKKVKIGTLEVEPNQSGMIGADNVPPMFERYLTGLRISGPGNIAIRRS